MVRTRWLVVGFLLTAAVVGGVLNARGPFDAHPAVAYDQFLADLQAGHVGTIVQWRDRLEVTEAGVALSAVVPPDRDLMADLGRARSTGGVGMAYQAIPDWWLGSQTPWVPALLLVAAALIWVTSLVRHRRTSSRPLAPVSTRPAT